MTRRRWIADEVSENSAALTGDHAGHLARVLRARAGQQFDIIANGVLRRGTIASVSDHRVDFELGEEVSSGSTAPVTVLLSIFKFDRMDWAVEKCTELGAERIVPMIARRTEAHLASAAAKRVERWQRIAKQAAEQSRRISVPEILCPMESQEASRIPAQSRFILDESEREVRLTEAFSESEPRELALAFGPEGGWTEQELQLFRDAGWKSASLGSAILRVETAVIAALAITISSLG